MNGTSDETEAEDEEMMPESALELPGLDYSEEYRARFRRELKEQEEP